MAPCIVAVDIDLIQPTATNCWRRAITRWPFVRTVREPLVVLDGDCVSGLANEAFYRLFRRHDRDTEGRLLWETATRRLDDPELQRALLAACAGRGDRSSTSKSLARCRGTAQRTLRLNARSIRPRGPSVPAAARHRRRHRRAPGARLCASRPRRCDCVNRRKDEFLGMLAHELRNPLAPMRFALEVLRRCRGEPRRRRTARQVLDRQVTHLVRIVDDLLDVSRITQGKVELRKEQIELADIVHAAVELCRPAIDAANHTLTVSLPDEPVSLIADPVRLTQVLVNLLNNAVKFTPPADHIWLIAETPASRRRPGHGPDSRARYGHRDRAGRAADVFDMFMQGDRSLEKTRGGLGVGLTLVRNLVALHGGAIEVRSEGVDRGSEFVVSLPCEPAPKHAQPPPPRPGRDAWLEACAFW